MSISSNLPHYIRLDRSVHLGGKNTGIQPTTSSGQTSPGRRSPVVYLYGTQNELYEIIMSVLKRQEGLTVKYLGDGDFPTGAPGGTVLVWGLEEETNVPAGYRVANVLTAL